MSRPSRGERRQPPRQAASTADNDTSPPDSHTSAAAAATKAPSAYSLSSVPPQPSVMAPSSSAEACTSAAPSNFLPAAAPLAGPSYDDASAHASGQLDKKSHKSKSHVPPAVPRPPNAWILYRSARLRASAEGPDGAVDAPAVAAASASSSSSSSHPALSAFKLRQGDLSKRLSEAWKAESPQVRAHFYALASQRQEEHKLAYPDYKYTPRVTDKLAKSREARAAAAAAAREEKAKQEAEERARQGGENDAEAASEDVKPKRKASRKRTSTAAAPKRRTSSPTKLDAAEQEFAAAQEAANSVSASVMQSSGFEARPVGRTMRRNTLTPATSPRSPARAGPYPPTSPHLRSLSTRTSFEDASPALLSLASSSSEQQQQQSLRRPSYGRRSISVAAADWPPSLFIDAATHTDATAAARASAPLMSPVDSRGSSNNASGQDAPPNAFNAAAPLMSAWGDVHARDASIWHHEAQQHQSNASEALPMLIHPDLLSISGGGGGDASGQASDTSMAAANESLETKPHLRSPLELGARATEELGMFGGVGAPMYEAADGSLVNFMLPDSLDHQAAMLLLMSDDQEGGAGSSAEPSRSAGNNGHDMSRNNTGSDGQLFALEVDGSLRPAGFMHFDSWVPHSQQQQQQQQGNVDAGAYRHVEGNAGWSGAHNVSSQPFEQSLEAATAEQMSSRSGVGSWPDWGKPMHEMHGLAGAGAGGKVTSQPMLQTQSESSRSAQQHAAHQSANSASYPWDTQRSNTDHVMTHYPSPAVQQAPLHHADEHASSSSSSQVQHSPPAPSGLTVSPQDLSSARNFSRPLAASVSPAQVLRPMRPEPMSYEMPWETVVADAQRAFRRSQAVDAEPSFETYGSLPSADSGMPSHAAPPHASRAEYVHQHMPSSSVALPNGQVGSQSSCSQQSQAPSTRAAAESPLPRSHAAASKEHQWQAQTTSPNPAETSPPALELSGLFTEADLLAHLEVLRTQRQQGPA